MTERIEDSFRAIYAKDVNQVNALAEKYGVTHLIIRRTAFSGARVREGRVYRDEFDKFVSELTQAPGEFVLNPPPWRSIIQSDPNFWVVRLPLL